MKSTFKLLALSLLCLSVNLRAAEYVKCEHRAYPKSQITALDLSNKFGLVEIRDTGGDSVTVDMKITVKNMSASRAERLLGQISTDIRRSGGLLKVETLFSSNFRGNGSFSVDYLVNIPRDRDLTISNKFGNVVLQDLEGRGRFILAYGSLTAGKLQPRQQIPVWLDLAYGKADISTVDQLHGAIRYSKLYLRSAEYLELNSKYSGLNVGKTGSLKLDSKYDGISLEKTEKLEASSRYTNYTIGLLGRQIKLDSSYGSVRIERVSPAFRSLEITSSYGGISANMQEVSYDLDAECEYCEIRYPDERFRGDRSRESHRFRLLGKVGQPEAGQKVMIRSRYGDVKLDR
ncbi:MAG: hypothetical protein AB7D05_08845 [Mangrovibacterium sp.]